MTAPEAVVIGDTPQDVLSATAAGATAVAVATGKFTASELAPHGPRFVLASLAELPELLVREFPGAPR